MITADNIADEQIRELLAEAKRERNQRLIYDCTEALLDEHIDSKQIKACRAACAEAFNARAGVPVSAETLSIEQIDLVWRIGADEGVHGNQDVMHVATVAANRHRDFTASEQQEARARCAEILEARRKEGK